MAAKEELERKKYAKTLANNQIDVVRPCPFSPLFSNGTHKHRTIPSLFRKEKMKTRYMKYTLFSLEKKKCNTSRCYKLDALQKFFFSLVPGQYSHEGVPNFLWVAFVIYKLSL